MVRALTSPVIILFVLLILPCSAQSTTVSARVDRNPVAIDESLTYQLEIQDPSGGDPDFTPLEKDFEILSQSSSTNMQIINGTRSHSKQYHLTLLPKRIGKLTIPPIVVGQHTSNAIDLVVTTAAPTQPGSGADFMLDVQATPESPYVGEQVLITVRLYIGASLVSGSLSEPGTDQAEVTKLGEDREFSTTRSGRNYRVNERRYVLFPQQPGSLTIPSVVFQGQTGRRSSSFFDPFSQAGPVRRVRSKELHLTVRPKPEHAPQPWLPAANLSATMELSQTADTLKVGEPVTLDLSINAEGLKATQLPEPQIKVDGEVRTYPDQPSFNDGQGAKGITATLKKKITVIAQEPGTITITPEPIGWWNTTTDRLEYASFKPLTLDVLPGAAPAQPTPSVLAAPGKEQESPPRQTAPPSFWTTQVGWFWVSIGLGCCWLITLFAWHIRRKKSTPLPVSDKTPDTDSISALEKKLKKSCTCGDARGARECMHQILASKPGSQLEYQELKNALLELNEYLYSPEAGKKAWNGAGLWSAYQAAVARGKIASTGKKENGLAPLYDNPSV